MSNKLVKKKKNNVDVLLVSYDDQSNDEPIMIVGRKRSNGSIDIVNAFQGEEAVDFYNALTTVINKEEKDEN